MNSDRKQKLLVLISLLIVIVTLGIGFSAFTNTFRISSSAVVTPTNNSFNVMFSSNSNTVERNLITPTTSSNEIVAQDAVISSTNATTISNLNATFTKPGQSMTYTFYVLNQGGYDAYLTQIDFSNANGQNVPINCVAVNIAHTTSVQNTCSYISVSISVGEGTNQVVSTSSTSVSNHTLARNSSELVTVTISYASGAPEAEGAFNATFGNLSLTYQDSDTTTPGGDIQNATLASCFVSTTAGQINDYLVGNEGCGTNVKLPINLSLPLSEITSLSFNMSKCMAFINDTNICNNMQSNYESKTRNEILSTEYKFASDIVYTVINQDTTAVNIIGDEAFGAMGITSFDFNNNDISQIKMRAFTYNQLTNIVFPSNLSNIGDYAFAENQLSNITFPNNLTSIGAGSFLGNDISTDVSISENVINIGAEAFRYNYIPTIYVNRTETDFIANVTVGEDWHETSTNVEFLKVFIIDNEGTITKYNYDLGGTDVVVPRYVDGIEVRKIGSNAFKFANVIIYDRYIEITDEINYNQIQTALETMIGSGISNYTFVHSGDSAIASLISTQSIYINPTTGEMSSGVLATTLDLSQAIGLIEIGSNAFFSGNISSLILGNSVKTIGEMAFYDNQISGQLIIPNSVLTIDDHAFSSNQISGQLIIPNSVLTIDNYAFSSNQIISLVIPNSVTTIGNYVFYNNYIDTLTIDSGIITLGSSPFISYGDNPIRNLILEKCVYPICNHSLYGNSLSNLVINSGSIPANSFSNYKINSLTLGSGVTTIGEYAFYGSNISGELVLPNSITTIGNYAFSNNQISGELVLPNSVTTISNSAFSNNQISSLSLLNGITTIGEYAFSNNQISGELVLPNSITTISNIAFSNNQISTVAFATNSQVSYISGFDNNLLTSISFPSSVTTVGYYAFSNNQISGQLVIPNNVTTISNNAFSNNSLTSLNLGSGLTRIEQNAFTNATGYTLSSINVNMTEANFNSNVVKVTPWYNTSDNPTFTYLSS